MRRNDWLMQEKLSETAKNRCKLVNTTPYSLHTNYLNDQYLNT